MIFDFAAKEKEIELLDKIIARSDFWDEQDKAQEIMQKRSSLLSDLETHKQLENRLHDVEALFQIGIEEDDEPTIKEAYDEIIELKNDLNSLELRYYLSGEYDKNNVIVAIHPGAGGVESQDWAEMLLRMYTKWLDKKKYKYKIVDLQPGQEAGIKSVSFIVNALNAYGYMRSESGVHRMVRISPFDSSARRHTSFASVFIYPEIDENIKVEINDSDLRIDTYHASGAGGQHVNVTDSAVRITHLPTNIVAQCQNERSQFQNKEIAMKILRSKLYERMRLEKEEEISKLKADKKDIAWGSQIRSYIFHPYQMVKDHRTNIETGNITSVMNGEIDIFINAYLRGLKNNIS
ncbi:MAG: peptide chain release factor 2 [bacterium]